MRVAYHVRWFEIMGLDGEGVRGEGEGDTRAGGGCRSNFGVRYYGTYHIHVVVQFIPVPNYISSEVLL